MPVGEDAFRQLALQRAVAVRDALMARGLPSERLFLAAPRLQEAAVTSLPSDEAARAAARKEAAVWKPTARLAVGLH